MDFYLHICKDIVTVDSSCYLAHYTLDVGCNAQKCPYNMDLSWRSDNSATLRRFEYVVCSITEWLMVRWGVPYNYFKPPPRCNLHCGCAHSFTTESRWHRVVVVVVFFSFTHEWFVVHVRDWFVVHISGPCLVPVRGKQFRSFLDVASQHKKD